jgi:glutathione S-transferase
VLKNRILDFSAPDLAVRMARRPRADVLSSQLKDKAMKLYYSPGACSLSPHIVLREAGISCSLERVDLSKHQLSSGADYYAINPKGAVPVLELDNGERLTEGSVISQYIAEKAGNTQLLPAAGTMPRYRVAEWQNYITSELHKSFAPLFGHPELDALGKSAYSNHLKKKFSWVSQQLQGKQFLTGDTFTVADAYLFVVSGWASHVKLDLSESPNVQAFMGRVAQRPAVQEAMKAEGLI